MKRTLSQILLCAVVTVLLVCTLSACGKKETPVDDIGVLQMDTKYILDSQINNDNDSLLYFIFHDDGTGEYRCYEKVSDSTCRDYTLIFKYTFVSGDKSAIVCFYDSVKYNQENHNSGVVYKEWRTILNVSKNVLMRTTTSGFNFYVNENYAAENLPNYNNYNK